MQGLIFSWGLVYISPTGCSQKSCEKAHRYTSYCCVLLFAITGTIFADSKAADAQVYSSTQRSIPLL